MIDLTLGDTEIIRGYCFSEGLSITETAYVLATAAHETAHTMKPVREAFWLSEGWRRRNLRYYPWYGRGYVQITWKENYVRMGQRLGLDLTSNPDVVMKPEISAKILVVGMVEGLFTGKKLSDYFAGKKKDYRGARRIINGRDKNVKIAALARNYEDALTAENNSRLPLTCSNCGNEIERNQA